jgi:hypothetical protein
MPQGSGRQVEIGGNNPTQPQGNLGWPSGPPQQANAGDLAKQIATILVADPRFRGEKGDQGKQGLAGPQGPKGDAGEVSDEHLATIAAAVFAKMKTDPTFRGPKGDPGDGISQAEIERLKVEILASIPDLRVMLVDGSTGTVIDDETYTPGEPLVLDFQRIINAAKQR